MLFKPEVGGASTTEEGLLVPEILLAMVFSMQTTSPDLLHPIPSSAQFAYVWMLLQFLVLRVLQATDVL